MSSVEVVLKVIVVEGAVCGTKIIGPKSLASETTHLSPVNQGLRSTTLIGIAELVVCEAIGKVPNAWASAVQSGGGLVALDNRVAAMT